MADPAYANSGQFVWSGTGGLSSAYNVGAGSDRVLFVYVARHMEGTISGITYGGVALTQVKTGQSSRLGVTVLLDVWVLHAPTANSNTLAITTANHLSTTRWISMAEVFTNADQSLANYLKANEEYAADTQSATTTNSWTHDHASDANSLLINAWCTKGTGGGTHGGLAASQTERLEGDNGYGTILSITDKAGDGTTLTVSGSITGSQANSVGYVWSHVLLPPQSILVDSSGVPATAVGSVFIGGIEDANLAISPEAIVETLTISIGAILVTYPIEADMFIGIK